MSNFGACELQTVTSLKHALRNLSAWNIGTIGVHLFVLLWSRWRKPTDVKPWKSEPPNAQCFQTSVIKLIDLKLLDLRAPNCQCLKTCIEKPIDLNHWKSRGPTVRLPPDSLKRTYRFETFNISAKESILANIYWKRLSTSNFGVRAPNCQCLEACIQKPIDLYHLESRGPTVRPPLISLKKTYRFETLQISASKRSMRSEQLLRKLVDFKL